MSENTREISLGEAKKLYNLSEEAKTFLLTKFTKEELEGKEVPTQEEFNNFFEENIFPLIDHSKSIFLDDNGNRYRFKIPTTQIELRNSDDKLLFDYNYGQKNQYFLYSYNYVYSIFMKQFSLQNVDRHRLMKSLVEKYFNLHVCKPMRIGFLY